MSRTALVKTAAIKYIFACKSITGTEYVFQTTTAGTVLLTPLSGRNRETIAANRFYAENSYFKLGYSFTHNLFYASFTDVLIEIDPVRRVVNEYKIPFGFYLNPFVNNGDTRLDGVNRIVPSDDGKIYLASDQKEGLPSLAVFDPETKTFNYNRVPDWNLAFVHGSRYIPAVKVTTAGAFQGVYCQFLRSSANIDDSLLSTIYSEAAGSGIEISMQLPLLHYSDRAPGSSTRRVFVPMYHPSLSQTYWTFVDVKNPTNYYRSNSLSNQTNQQAVAGTYVDQSSASVDSSGWTGGDMDDYRADTGLATRTLNWGFSTGLVFKWGRFGYWRTSCASGSIEYCIPFDLTTLKPVYAANLDPLSTVDFYTNYYDNPTYQFGVLNFGTGGTALGYQNNTNENVLLMTNVDGDRGFMLPNGTFHLYDWQTDTSGWVVVSNADPGSDYGFIAPTFENTSETDIDGESWLTAPDINGAVRADYIQETNPANNRAKITQTFWEDYSDANSRVWTSVANNVGSVSGELTIVLKTVDEEYIAIGQTYTGTSIYDSAFTLLKTISQNPISPRTAIIAGANNYAVAGYVNATKIGDLALQSEANVSTAITGKATFAAYYNGWVILAGKEVRNPGYRNGYRHTGRINVSTSLAEKFPDLPNRLNWETAVALRAAIGLDQPSYNDTDAETAFAAYILAQGISRTQGIALLKDTCLFSSAGLHVDDSGNVFEGLIYDGYAALSGIQVRETLPSGDFVTQTIDLLSFQPEIVVYPYNASSESDYKTVVFTNAAFTGQESLGMLGGSDNYVFFVLNDPDNQQAIIRVFAISDVLTAANGSGEISGQGTLVTVPTGSTSESYGLGAAAGLFSSNNKVQNFYAAKEDVVYMTCTLLASPNVAVIAVNLAAGTYQNFATLAGTSVKGIFYDPASDHLGIVENDTYYEISDVASATPPIALT